MVATRSVLITGCSDGGIGAALAHAFADRADFHVFATARDVEKMASLSSRTGVTLLELDVTDEKMIALVVQSVTDKTGRLDFLINNAGRNHFMPLLDESIESAKAIFDTNVWGALLLIKAFVPLLIAAKGTIVSITSVSGYINIPWMGTYAASKRSMEIMAETLRLELLPFSVRVVSVVTATVKTNGFDYFEDLTLPEESLYKSIEATIRGRAQGSGSKHRMKANEYAQKVISRLVHSGATRAEPAGVLWGPGFTPSFIRIVAAWLPTSILDSMWLKGTGIDQMMQKK